MENCIFCNIIKGEITSKKIYEDDLIYVFLDLNQECIVHSLIIPKKHYLDLHDIPSDLLNHILNVANILYKDFESKLKCDGLTLLQNNGCAQDVKHFHLHLLPKYINKPKLSIDEIYEILKQK